MADGAGSLVYVAGSGVTLLAINSDGSINVNINSGDSIAIDSGVGVVVNSGHGVLVNSGHGVIINSGVGVTVASGHNVIIGGSGGTMPGVVVGNAATYTVGDFYLKTIAANVTFDTAAGIWRPVSTSLSGLRNLQVATSGLNHIITNASGESSGIGVIINSGVGVIINSGVGVLASFSGNIVTAKMSGETFANQIPTAGRARGIIQVTGNSGGDLLASGDTNTVTIRMITKASGGTNDASGFILVGFDAAGERPYLGGAGNELQSGYGATVLFPGDAYTVAINNMNKLRVVSKMSGEMIAYGGNVY